MTPRQECSDSKTEEDSNDESHGDDIELVERYMPSPSSFAPQTTTTSTSYAPQAATSYSATAQSTTTYKTTTKAPTLTSQIPYVEAYGSSSQPPKSIKDLLR